MGPAPEAPSADTHCLLARADCSTHWAMSSCFKQKVAPGRARTCQRLVHIQEHFTVQLLSAQKC